MELAAGVAVAVVVGVHGSSEAKFCEGLGLSSPPASSPEAALVAALRSEHGRLDEWKRAGQRTVDLPRADRYKVIDFVPKHLPVRPSYSRISVSNRSATWSADGACIAPRE